MPVTLPPPPQSGTVLDRWLNLLWRKFSASGEFDHNSGGSLQGGTADEYYHLTSTEYTGTGTGAFVRQDSPSITGSGSTPALKITQTGTGNALLVEDSASTDSTPFVVDANGNVMTGITTAASSFISFGNYRPGTNITWLQSYSNNTTGPALYFSKTRGTSPASQGLSASEDIIGTINFSASDGVDNRDAARIQAVVDGTTGSGDMPGRLLFLTTPDGSTTLAERMRITNAGNVLVGTTTDDGSTKLRVNGTLKTAGYTVATLPAGVVGQRAYVTDATAPTFLGTLTGGGSVTCPVFYNGSAWVVG